MKLGDHIRGRDRIHRVARIDLGEFRSYVTFTCGGQTSFGPLGARAEYEATTSPVDCKHCLDPDARRRTLMSEPNDRK